MVKFLILLACTPLLIFVLQMVATRICVRYRLDISSQIVVIICVVIGHIPMGVVIWVLYLRHLTTFVELLWAGIYSLVVYNAFAYSYFHIFNMSDTARRIRILHEIRISKQLRASDIASLYSANDMLNSRLERLLSMKQIKRCGDRYLLNRRLLYYAARIVASWGSLLAFPQPQTPVREDDKKGIFPEKRIW